MTRPEATTTLTLTEIDRSAAISQLFSKQSGSTLRITWARCTVNAHHNASSSGHGLSR